MDVPAGVLRISPPSFYGACLNFSREKDSGPFPSSIMKSNLYINELIVLHLLKIPARVTAPRFELTSQRQKVSTLPTEPPG